MREKLIKAYVNKLTKQDIIRYAYKENIELTQLEINYIYNTLKKDIDLMLKKPLIILEQAKTVLNSRTYNKLYELYTMYYPKLNH